MKKSLGIGTFALPSPVWVVGTYDAAGKPNLMTAAWGGICNSRPPSIYVSLRKATYSHGNIMARRAYTVSIPSEKYVKETDWIGIATGRELDKFVTAKLTPVRGSVVDAPYVDEFPVVLECRVREVFELGLHTQFVGEILDVKAEVDVLNEKGAIDIEKVRPIIFAAGTGTYHGVGKKIQDAFTIRELKKD
ncbi:MAG: flavin reductase family protein [Candidatus Bathyarchaeia archaeon]|jgi:flavin reductase (DIM6/NTAB) family NADH-FMN oxidoreductase RutF